MNRCQIFDQTVVAALIGLACSLAFCPSISAQTVCNGTVSQFLQATPAEERNFTGPQNGRLPLNWSCTWNIQAPKGYVIKLTFTKMSLYKTTAISCRDNSFVLIRDGGNRSAQIVRNSCQGEFQNFLLDKPFYSVNNYLSISYASGTYVYAAIFIQYEAIQPASSCLSSQSLDTNRNIFVNGSHGNLILPGAKIDCIWRITAPSNRIIKVVYPQLNCREGLYVEVYDGIYGMSDHKMQDHCVRERPFKVSYSTGRSLSVRVWTLAVPILPKGGFSANFSAIMQERSGSCAVGANSSLIAVKGEEGSIFVPKYRTAILGDYRAPNMDCTWTIQVPLNKLIKLQFQRLSNMNYGYLEVRDGRFGNSVQLFKFCELSFREFYPVLPRPIYSSGQLLQFKLHYRQFYFATFQWNSILVSYKAVSAVPPPTPGICSQNNTPALNNDIRLSDSSGSFRTPNYPKYFPRAISCTWKITAPLGKRIRLTFRREGSMGYKQEDCLLRDNNYLEFRDGLTVSSKEIRGKFCGEDLPAAVISSGRDMWVRFVSSCQISFNAGFEAQYEAELTGGTIALIVVVVLLMVAVIAVAVYCVWRKHRGSTTDPSTVSHAGVPTA